MSAYTLVVVAGYAAVWIVAGVVAAAATVASTVLRRRGGGDPGAVERIADGDEP